MINTSNLIRLTVLYPANPAGTFDFDYYLNTHMPLSAELLQEYGLLRYEVDRCVSSISGDAPAFLCITRLEFSSLEQLQTGMRIHGPVLRQDFSRYTNITPVATVCSAAGAKDLAPPQP